VGLFAELEFEKLPENKGQVIVSSLSTSVLRLAFPGVPHSQKIGKLHQFET
jgi:hypothetical protein